MTVKRPVLRYHGGKWRIAPWIIAQMPPHRVYVEPFGGAASVLMQKPRSYAEVYNERDGEIVNLFQVVRSRGADLLQQLRDTPFARREFNLSYIPAEDTLEQARRTVVRSFMGFGSAGACGAKTGFRGNSTRSGTIPAADWANFPDCLQAMTSRLRGVVIESSDAAKVMLQHDGADVLHYVDPPYVLHTRRKMNPHCKKGYRFELSDEDHARLSETLGQLGGMVMISGYPSAIYDRLYEGWERVECAARAGKAKPRTECLWFNSAAWERRPQVQMFNG